MKVFTFGELWGTAPCSICGKEDYFVILSDREEKDIEGMSGSNAANLICNANMGINACGDHIKEFMKDDTD